MHTARRLTILTLTAALAGGAVALHGTAGSASTSSAGANTITIEQPTNPTVEQATTERSIADRFDNTNVTEELRRADRSATGIVEIQTLHRPGEAVAGTDGGRWTTMAEMMEYVVRDAANVWTWYYHQWWGQGTSSVKYNFPAAGTTIQGCGETVDDNASPFYCPADDTIYFSQGRALAYWRNSGGDYGVATSLAHEYGHNVQAELHISRSTYGSAKFEQHADCLSGAFTHVAYYQNILDHNDITEAKASRAMVGDDGVSGPDPHGTAEQRIAAFMLGYNSAGPAGCDAILS